MRGRNYAAAGQIGTRTPGFKITKPDPLWRTQSLGEKPGLQGSGVRGRGWGGGGVPGFGFLWMLRTGRRDQVSSENKPESDPQLYTPAGHTGKKGGCKIRGFSPNQGKTQRRSHRAAALFRRFPQLLSPLLPPESLPPGPQQPSPAADHTRKQEPAKCTGRHTEDSEEPHPKQRRLR